MAKGQQQCHSTQPQGTAQSTHLDGVNVRGDDDQAGLLVLHQVRDVVQAVLDVARALGVVSGGTGSLVLSGGLQTLNLLRLRLRAVLLEQLEHGHSCSGAEVRCTANRQGM